MAHSLDFQGDRNDIASPAPAPTNPFKVEMQRIKRNFESSAKAVSKFRKKMTEKHNAYIKLKTEQDDLCDIAERCYIARWEHFACFPGKNPARAAIEQEIEPYLIKRDAFKSKSDALGSTFMNSFKKVKRHTCALNSIMEVVKQENSVDNLKNISIPDPDWIQSIPDPRIEELYEEWNQIELKPKLSNFLDQMNQLIESSDQSSQGDSASSVEDALMREAKRIARHYLFVRKEYYALRKIMHEKQQLFFNQWTQQLDIYDSISKYNIAWLENALVYPRSEERQTLESNLRPILEDLRNWKVQLDGCENLFTRYFKAMKTNGNILNAGTEKLIKSKTAEDLKDVPIINTDWILALRYPNIEKITDKGNQLAVEPKVRSFIRVMKQLTVLDRICEPILPRDR